MTRELKRALLGAAAFVLVGIVLVNSPVAPAKVAGWLAIVVFGGGGIAAAVAVLRGRPAGREAAAMLVDHVTVEQLEPVEDEILEEWVHSSESRPFLNVSALKWRDESEFPWKVSVHLAELAREEPSVTLLDDAIFEALSDTANVTGVVRDDTEVWLVAGSPSGEDLVRNAGKVLAVCGPVIVSQLDGAGKG